MKQNIIFLHCFFLMHARYYISIEYQIDFLICLFELIFINRSVRYARAGENNPTAKLYVRKVNEVENKEVIPPKKVLNWREYIYTDVKWASDTDFR